MAKDVHGTPYYRRKPKPPRCAVIVVDGLPIRCQADTNITPESRAALEDIVRAARRRLEKAVDGEL